ncbi:MAG: 4Fe-4S dicluster domain-containing protein [Atribacterota bacterium]
MYEEEIRALSVKILGEVEWIIGYAHGTLPFRARPFLCQKKEDVTQLTFNHFCGHNLVKYLLDRNAKERKVAIFAKACDVRAIMVLIRERQVKRENLVIAGIPCYGMVDRKKLEEHFGSVRPSDFEWHLDSFTFRGKTMSIGPFLDATCQRCLHPNPPLYDYLVGQEVQYIPRERWNQNALKKVDTLSREERWTFFAGESKKCIRCYACRNACPLCYCKECFAEMQRPYWLSGAATPNENLLFHIGRSLHMAGRCVECGACERACPVGIPIALLPCKVEELIRENFDFEAGVNPDKEPPLLTYRENDPNEFIR